MKFVLAIILVFAPVAASADGPPAAAIASAHPLATEAGHRILAEGGNAFDAAIAVAAMLGVVEPQSSGLGGGAFWLLHRARDGRDVAVDARERAPLAARADLYLDRDGNVVPRLSLDGPLAAAVPGAPAALDHIARGYGRLPLRKTLAPAIEAAESGFAVRERYRRLASLRLGALTGPAAEVFLDRGEVPEPGYIVRQPALAQTLRRLAEHGEKGFYQGPVAERLVAGVRAEGGIWTARDLLEYRVIEREPVSINFRGFKVTSVPPPAGGVVVLEMLNILAPYAGIADTVTRGHYTIEAMRLAYRDRAEHLGDPEHVRVDVKRLLSRDRAAKLRREIRPAVFADETPRAAAGGRHTTHFSVLDKEGNRVAATLSINAPFGSGFMPAGTGVLLNNEMDDFVAKPGVPNLYGLIGSRANAIAPGKRPLSSMSPTFVESERGVAILGTPGGSRIISMVALAVLDYSAGLPLSEWIARPRFHHQYLPELVEYEPGAFAEAEIAGLTRLGHRLKRVDRPYGDMHAVVWDRKTGKVDAASDPRGEGAARVR